MIGVSVLIARMLKEMFNVMKLLEMGCVERGMNVNFWRL